MFERSYFVAPYDVAANRGELAQDNSALQDGALHVGRWRIDLSARTATDGHRVRRLSPRASDVLNVLAHAKGEVVSRRELLDAVWPHVTVGDESLTQAVAELRRAFGDRRRGARHIIETIPKRGYRLTVPVLHDVQGGRRTQKAEPDGFNLDAYLLCLQGREVILQGGANDIERSESLRLEAVRVGPRFALAHAQYSVVLALAGLYLPGRAEAFERALDHAETATRLRPDLAFAHAARGFALSTLGRAEAARQAFGRSFGIDANDPEAGYLCAKASFCARDYRLVAAIGERDLAFGGNDYRTIFLAARSTPADPDRERRNLLAVRTRVDAALALDPRPRAMNVRAAILALMGEREEARSAMEAAAAPDALHCFYKAVAAAALDDRDAALEALEAALDLGYRDGKWLRAEPLFARLASEPRFARLESALSAA